MLGFASDAHTINEFVYEAFTLQNGESDEHQ